MVDTIIRVDIIIMEEELDNIIIVINKAIRLAPLGFEQILSPAQFSH